MKEVLTPEDHYQELFYDIHRQHIFQDGKSFADARAKMHPSIILKTYREEKYQEDFDLRNFVYQYFEIPVLESEENRVQFPHIDDHLNNLWKQLLRQPKLSKQRNSKLPLPYPYIVPGGRFDEIYYWDSYFTMLGLRVAGLEDIVENMVNNFRHLISTYGHIPNGNRTYFLSRSQPPFYSLMIKLLIEIRGKDIIPQYIDSLVSEYNFWMKDLNDATKDQAVGRVVKLTKAIFLNRYFDAKNTPREEMYGDDWQLINYSTDREQPLFRELRAACESGWDFSSRWLRDPNDLGTAHTTDILPVDLNCLLWHLEKLISECLYFLNKDELALQYGILAANRKRAINEYFWDEESGFYYDYDWKMSRLRIDRPSLAGIFPLFFGLCDESQADQSASMIESRFLKDGGVVTTTMETGQQWDYPNGWAPLQWMTVKGLLNAGHKTLAQEIAHRWTTLNRNVYQRTGKMLEKYNVIDTTLKGGGGEYPVQDGFGWTNGVYLALINL